ncbi:DNA-methyltransferase [Paenilisteria rocourtiae]|uniref:Methyltransferase n=1 Tax=Listeria rocourtiae TaxID=647910 RepID=A0A4R6ZRQ0_9LIST|nr:site-specific DNA-methyltransferase [Listeria rocourtiae]TDR54819.1 site-specific DNA-methyltransferase (adenine-specific)/modification methylase [Listeria rocourtiae]
MKEYGVFRLQNIKLINNVFKADCIKKMKLIETESIDMILCDLPYGHTQNKWDSIIPLDILWKEYERIIKPNGAIVLTSSGMFTAELMLSNPKLFKYKIIWEKSKATNFLNAKKQPLRKYEEICVFYKKQPTYNPQMSMGVPYNKGTRKNQLTGSYGDFLPVEVKSEGARYPNDIIYFKTAESEGKVYHPTQKPIELGRYLVKTYTNLGDTVLDNTCGSGSFLISALLEGRNFIGIEKDEDSNRFKADSVSYVEISKKRIKEAYLTLDSESKERITLYKSKLFKER